MIRIKLQKKYNVHLTILVVYKILDLPKYGTCSNRMRWKNKEEAIDDHLLVLSWTKNLINETLTKYYVEWDQE